MEQFTWATPDLPEFTGVSAEVSTSASVAPTVDLSEISISFASDEDKWRAVTDRNPVANNMFVYGVSTTKIFCRPGCPARLPRRTNAVFFTTPADAIAAGYRACMRCRPAHSDTARATMITNACRIIDSNPKISLDELAKASNLSKFHFLRTFKSVTGITPQQYKMAAREKTTTAAVGRVVFAVGPCYLGHILVAVSERGICAVELGDDPDVLIESFQHRFRNAEITANHPEFNSLISILGGTAESSRISEWELPLDIQGTAFQHRVWNSLRDIPWGQTRTYSDIATAIGSPAAVRAVAKACASNPVAIAIPCHRVVRSDHHPSGYRWGLERKSALYEMEQQNALEDAGLEEFRLWLENCMQGMETPTMDVNLQGMEI